MLKTIVINPNLLHRLLPNRMRGQQKSDDEKQKAVETNNDISVGAIDMKRSEVSVLSRSDELSEQANRYAGWQTVFSFGTLILAAIATFFAIAAWWESRKGVKITSIATELEY